MQKMTSAYANKKLKSLEEDKAFWVNKEATSCTYIAAINEEPVIPEYDYLEVAQIIEDIDAKIAVLKHAINLNNAMAKVPVGDEKMSIDTILVKMAQLNKRKNVLDMMRKQLPKERLDNSYRVRNSIAEYRYINYDPALINDRPPVDRPADAGLGHGQRGGTQGSGHGPRLGDRPHVEDDAL